MISALKCPFYLFTFSLVFLHVMDVKDTEVDNIEAYLLSKPLSPKSHFVFDFYVDVMRQLNAQRKSKQFCDTIIECNGMEFYSHKCILATVCPYFHTMFLSELTADQHEKLQWKTTLNTFEPASFSLFLGILYCEEQLDIDSINIKDFLHLMDFLQTDSLIGYVVEKFKNALTTKNCLQLFVLAAESGLDSIEILAATYISSNITKIGWSKIVEKLNQDDLKRLLKSKVIQSHLVDLIPQELLRRSANFSLREEGELDVLQMLVDVYAYSEDTYNKAITFAENFEDYSAVATFTGWKLSASSITPKLISSNEVSDNQVLLLFDSTPIKGSHHSHVIRSHVEIETVGTTFFPSDLDPSDIQVMNYFVWRSELYAVFNRITVGKLYIEKYNQFTKEFHPFLSCNPKNWFEEDQSLFEYYMTLISVHCVGDQLYLLFDADDSLTSSICLCSTRIGNASLALTSPPLVLDNQINFYTLFTDDMLYLAGLFESQPSMNMVALPTFEVTSFEAPFSLLDKALSPQSEKFFVTYRNELYCFLETIDIFTVLVLIPSEMRWENLTSKQKCETDVGDRFLQGLFVFGDKIGLIFVEVGEDGKEWASSCNCVLYFDPESFEWSPIVSFNEKYFHVEYNSIVFPKHILL